MRLLPMLKKRQKSLDRSRQRNVHAEISKTRTGNHAGPHHTRDLDIKKGNSRKPKHKKAPDDSEAF